MMDVAIAKEAAAVGPLTLPEGWCWATLEDVADGPQYGWTASAAATGKVRLLRTTDISSGKVDWATVPFCSESPADVEKYLLRDGDIVISRAGSVGKSFRISQPLRAVFASYLIRFQPRLDGKYLHYFLQTPAYWAQIVERSAGIAIPNVNGSKLKSVRLPLAPLLEQHRIVERVDTLFAEIAEGEAALAAARKGLETFRRALLKTAVTGELTKDWRALNPVSETGHDLLARITKDRASKAGAKERARPADCPSVDASTLTELPQGWAWAKVGDLLEFVTSGSRGWKEFYADDGAVFVRAQNINSGVLNLSDVAFVRLPSDAEGLRTRLKVNDVLVTITGANVTVSARVAHDLPEAYVNQHVLRPILPETSELILLWLQADGAGKSQLVDAAYGAGKPGLNLDNIRNVSIALPPPGETDEILRRVSEALSAAADAGAMLDAEAADVARLKQSVLKAAFEGRLVRHDPADEPASALLARLAANPGVTRATRRRTKEDQSKVHS